MKSENGGNRSGPVSVVLCIIATGKYWDFLTDLLDSARKYFLPGCRVVYFVFSNRKPLHNLDPLEWRIVPNIPWPDPTLYRYHWILEAEKALHQHDYIFYCDADCRFVDIVSEKILGDLVAVEHQGYIGIPPKQFTYERNPESAACILPGQEAEHYYAGGFQGGRTGPYIAAMEAMRQAIDQDMAAGITAVWHDESHWNRYLIDHPPDVILPPSYCCDEGNRVPNAKLVALRKDHAAMRGT